jgi:hypothetical protein
MPLRHSGLKLLNGAARRRGIIYSAALAVAPTFAIAQASSLSASRTLDLRVNLPEEGGARRLAVGDVVRVWPVICVTRGDVSECDTLTVRQRASLALRSTDSAVVRLDSRGRLSAVRPGRARVELRGNAQRADIDFQVFPLVTRFSWEPEVRTVHEGDTLSLTAVARDADGRIVARIPLSGVGMPTMLSLQISGWKDSSGVRVWGNAGSQIVLHAYLGHRDAVARVRAVVAAKPPRSRPNER